MPNTTVQAAGEAMPTVTLEALMADYVSAMEAVTAHPGSIEKTPVEAALLAAVDALAKTTAGPSSYEGMMQAIRLAGQEVEDFSGSDMGETLVKGVLAFLEEREMELPVERIERLAGELAETLPKWAGGSYMAMVYPEGDGRGYWFRHILHGASSTDALGKLRSLMDEAATILVKHPKLNIERIAVNEHGVHTFIKVPEVPARPPVDPLLTKIKDFQAGLERLRSIKDTITTENEERLVAETYGPLLDQLTEWDAPAVTLEGAIEALKLMKQQDVMNDPLGEAMRCAVLSFLEGVKP